MKCINLFLCGLILLLTGFLNEAEGKEYRIDFKTQQSNPDKLSRWSKSRHKSFDPEGEYAVINEKDGKNTLKITSYKKRTHFYNGGTKITAENDDILEVRLNAKGEGNGIIGFYFYGLNNHFIENKSKAFTPQSDWKEYKFTFTIKDANPKKPAVTSCRLVLGAEANSEVLFKDVFVLNKRSKEYLCIKTQTRPTVDGTVIGWDGMVPDKCWKDSVWGVGFKKPVSIESYPDQTKFSFSYDNERLYFMAVCYDQNIEKIKAAAKTEYDRIWADDSVEVFLDMHFTDKRVAHLTLNSLGTVNFRWENGVGQVSLARMQCKAKVYAGRWEIEFALPWKSLGVKAPVEGSIWSMNVARVHSHKGVSLKSYSTWAYLPEAVFMSPEYFIPLKFGKTEETAKALKEMTGPVPASVMRQAGSGALKSKKLIRGIPKARKDYNPVGVPVELPRITWANPFAGKSLRTLFVIRYAEREVWEMSRRLEMQKADVIFCTHKGCPGSNVGAFALNAEEITKNLIGQGKKYDVIVVATDIANTDLVNSIINNVKAGVGLVYISSPYADQIPEGFRKILPKPQLFENARINYVARNIAIEGLPYSSKHKPTLDNLGTSNNKAVKTIGFGEYGKGKIVNIGYSALTDGLTPHPDNYFYSAKSRAEGISFFDNQICNQWWENVFSLLMRSVCWVSGYKPDCEISSVLAKSGNMLVVNFDRPAMRALEIECIWDSMKVISRQEMKGERIKVLRNAESLKIKIPADIQKCHGVHFCHLILRDQENRKTIDWATGVVQIRSALTIGSLNTDKKRYKPGEETQLECIIANNGNITEKAKLRVLLKDPFKRIAREITQYTQVKGNESVVCNISVPLKRALTVQLSLQVELRNANNDLLDCVTCRIYVPKPYVPDDYKLSSILPPVKGFRNYLYPAYERLSLETGFNRINHSVNNKIFSGYPDFFNLYAGSVSIFYEPHHYSGEKRSGDKYQRHTAKSCINNKKRLDRRIKRSFLKRIAPNWEQGVFCFQMQDEGGLSGYGGNIPESDFCYCPTCRKLFKEYAQKLYGTIEKANSEWGTSFKDWDSIEPMVLEEAWQKSDRNYSLWVDYKFFMEDSYLNAFRKVKSKVNAKYPDVKLALTNASQGGNPREPLSGENYYKWAREEDCMMKYYGIMPVIGYASFSNKSVPKLKWWGYTEHVSHVRYAPWFYTFNGITLDWYHPFYIHPNGSRTDSMCLFSYNITRTERSLAIKETTQDLMRGVGKIILGAEPVKRLVAMLYSQASFYAACAEKQDGRYLASELQWRNLIRGAGYEFYFVAVEELEKKLHNYQVLVLPYSIALSADSQEVIKRFAESGGVVFCDGIPGCFDDHGRYLKGKGVLETVLTNASKEEIGAAAKIKCGNGEIILMDDAPAWTRDWKLFRKVLDQRKVKRGIDSILDLTLKEPAPNGKCEIYAFQKGGCRFYGIIGNGYNWGSRVPQQDKPVRICWKNKAHIYDVRQQKYLGFTNMTTTQIRLNKAKFYAAMPYEVKGIKVSCRFSKSDWKLHYQAKISNSKAEDHVFRVEVYDPEQQLIDVYTGNHWGEKGKLKREIPFAFNDKPGKWTIKIIDVISGISEKRTFILPKIR